MQGEDALGTRRARLPERGEQRALQGSGKQEGTCAALEERAQPALSAGGAEELQSRGREGRGMLEKKKK